MNILIPITEDTHIRWKPGKPKSVTPPALPPPLPSTTEIISQAASAGSAEARRTRRSSRLASRITSPGLLRAETDIERRQLKTSLG